MGRLVRLPLKALPDTMPILQGPARGKRWIVGAGPSMYWLGGYEHAKQRLLAGILTPGAVFYDVGAHVGYFTLLGAAIVGPRGRVVAFEPAPANVGFLRRHVRINALDNVDVHATAVGETPGELRFDDSTGSSFTGHVSDEGHLVVQSTSLDQVRSEGAPAPDVVKIDVEGAELMVLRGGEATIDAARPVILVATHGAEEHRASEAFLTRRGYRVEPLTAKGKTVPDELVAWP